MKTPWVRNLNYTDLNISGKKIGVTEENEAIDALEKVLNGEWVDLEQQKHALTQSKLGAYLIHKYLDGKLDQYITVEPNEKDTTISQLTAFRTTKWTIDSYLQNRTNHKKEEYTNPLNLGFSLTRKKAATDALLRALNGEQSELKKHKKVLKDGELGKRISGLLKDESLENYLNNGNQIKSVGKLIELLDKKNTEQNEIGNAKRAEIIVDMLQNKIGKVNTVRSSQYNFSKPPNVEIKSNKSNERQVPQENEKGKEAEEQKFTHAQPILPSTSSNSNANNAFSKSTTKTFCKVNDEELKKFIDICIDYADGVNFLRQPHGKLARNSVKMNPINFDLNSELVDDAIKLILRMIATSSQGANGQFIYEKPVRFLEMYNDSNNDIPDSIKERISNILQLDDGRLSEDYFENSEIKDMKEEVIQDKLQSQIHNQHAAN